MAALVLVTVSLHLPVSSFFFYNSISTLPSLNTAAFDIEVRDSDATSGSWDEVIEKMAPYMAVSGTPFVLKQKVKPTSIRSILVYCRGCLAIPWQN